MIKKILFVLLLLSNFVFADDFGLVGTNDIVPTINQITEEQEHVVEDVSDPVNSEVANIINTSEENGKIILYFFRGEGCSFCEKEMAWLGWVEQEYSEYLTIKTFETWNDHNNAEILNGVKNFYGFSNDASVPFNVVGDFAEVGIAPHQILRIENEIRKFAGLEEKEEATEYLKILDGETVLNSQEETKVETEAKPEAVVETEKNTNAYSSPSIIFALIVIIMLEPFAIYFVMKNVEHEKKIEKELIESCEGSKYQKYKNILGVMIKEPEKNSRRKLKIVVKEIYNDEELTKKELEDLEKDITKVERLFSYKLFNLI